MWFNLIKGNNMFGQDFIRALEGERPERDKKDL